MSALEAATPAEAFVEKVADTKAILDLIWLTLADPDDSCVGRGLMLATGQLAEIETAGLALAGTTVK
jgi:hypothetical protein